MSQIFTAIFDAGVFRPLRPVDLADGTTVQVLVLAAAADESTELPAAELARRQAQIEDMVTEIEQLPIEEPDDGFSGSNHDRFLYGRQ